MGELKKRVTKIAELFERKPITQSYTFDVLLDFINDKASRLLVKLDGLVADRKIMNEEKQYYYQRKLEELELEVDCNSEAAQFAETVLNDAIPRLQEIIQVAEVGDRYVNGLEVLKVCAQQLRLTRNSKVKRKANDLETKLQQARKLEQEEIRKAFKPDNTLF